MKRHLSNVNDKSFLPLVINYITYGISIRYMLLPRGMRSNELLLLISDCTVKAYFYKWMIIPRF